MVQRNIIIPSRRSFLAGLGASAIAIPALAASDLAIFSNGASGSSVRTTLNTVITRFQDVINVKDWGAIGDGSADDTASIQAALDAAYGTTGSPHGTASVTTNKPVFFPNGNYKVTSALTMRSVRGARIYGAGRLTTRIFNSATNGSVFVTNGFEYSIVEGLQLVSNGTGTCFDLDWDNTGPTALQSNSFRDIYLEAGAYGLRIGNSGFMGSENLVQNCYFANQTTAGLATKNGNALQQTVFDSNFAGCPIGIWVASGSCPIIHGVGFQNQTDADIAVDNSSNDTYSVKGCRSENSAGSGVYFARFHNGSSVHIASCSQLATAAGIFGYIETTPGAGAGPGVMSVDNCVSVNGTFTGNGTLYIRGNPVPPLAVTGAVNNGVGLIRLTVPSTAGLTTGRRANVSAVGGVPNATGNWPLTVINGTQVDLQTSIFAGTYTSGGLVTGGTFGNTGYLSSFTGLVAQNI